MQPNMAWLEKNSYGLFQSKKDLFSEQESNQGTSHSAEADLF